MDGGQALRSGDRTVRPNRHAYRLVPAGGHRHPMRSHSAFTDRVDTKRKGESSMHQLVILTALTATSGLFGGHGGCYTGGCARPTWNWCAPRTNCSPCGPYVAG